MRIIFVIYPYTNNLRLFIFHSLFNEKKREKWIWLMWIKCNNMSGLIKLMYNIFNNQVVTSCAKYYKTTQTPLKCSILSQI